MKKLTLILAITLLAVWLVGCSAAVEQPPTGTNDATDAESVAPEVTVTPERISAVEAKRIALERANVAEADVSRYESELDYDDDTARWEYDISFNVGNTEYDVEIRAQDGVIIRFEKEADREPSVTPTSSANTQTERPSTTTTEKPTSTVKSSVPTQTSAPGKISREEAKRIALTQANATEKDIARYTIELDYDDDARRWEYEISFDVGNIEYDIEIAAKDGKVLRMDKEIKDEPTPTVTQTKADIISKAKAKTLALSRAKVGEKDISRYEIELDYDDDTRRWEYEISFNVGRTEYDIVLDGKTGKVLEFEKDAE